MNDIKVSIILPAYNEEYRLPDCVFSVREFMRRQPYTWEAIIVENRSDDDTRAIAESIAATHREFSAMTSAPGKGAAVLAGMLAARGEYRYMCDVDLSTPISHLPRFLDACDEQYPIVIGSREADDAQRVDEPELRNSMGRIFNILLQMMLPYDLPSDTQCGFKMFRVDAALDLFHRQTLSGFAFDVEILYLARRLGYPIFELGVPWFYNDDSKVDALGRWKTAWRMFRDVRKIPALARLGVYGDLSQRSETALPVSTELNA